MSYFARLTDAATFSDQASAEIRRRGIERAKAVCAVQDGADWLVGLTHSHRADALRILRAGWPIGSGMVESGNKLVMQARLKGAGMHWAPEQVNAMLALRMALCNERWDAGWHDQLRWNRQTRSAQRQRKQQHRFTQRQHAHQPLEAPAVASAPQAPPKRPTGRTDAQYRWGRYTISPRVLRQGGLAKK